MSFMSSNVFCAFVVVVTIEPSGDVLCITSVYSPFSTCVGSVIYALFATPFPISPFELSPHAQIVPSCFSASECIFPTTTFSAVFLSSPITFTFTTASSSPLTDFSVMYAFPSFLAFTFPVYLSTVAMSVFELTYLNPLFVASSYNKLNPYIVFGCI